MVVVWEKLKACSFNKCWRGRFFYFFYKIGLLNMHSISKIGGPRHCSGLILPHCCNKVIVQDQASIYITKKNQSKMEPFRDRHGLEWQVIILLHCWDATIKSLPRPSFFIYNKRKFYKRWCRPKIYLNSTQRKNQELEHKYERGWLAAFRSSFWKLPQSRPLAGARILVNLPWPLLLKCFWLYRWINFKVTRGLVSLTFRVYH